MQFKKGTRIFSADEQDVGSVDRVVMDPDANEVSGLVVRHGVFADDKVVPLDLIMRATEDRITLNKSSEALQDLPKFEETYYVPADDARGVDEENLTPYTATAYADPLYAYPPIGTPWWGFGMYAGYMPTEAELEPQLAQRIQRNIPKGMVALKEGARVLSLDNKHVGNVEEIFTDAVTNHPTHLVISKGLLFKEHKLIPTNWVKQVNDEEVMLTVNTSIVDSLPAYDPSVTHA